MIQFLTTFLHTIAGRRGRGSARGLDIRELVRALLGLAVMVGSGPAALQLAPLMALGHLQQEHYPVCLFVLYVCVCDYVCVCVLPFTRLVASLLCLIGGFSSVKRMPYTRMHTQTGVSGRAGA